MSGTDRNNRRLHGQWMAMASGAAAAVGLGLVLGRALAAPSSARVQSTGPPPALTAVPPLPVVHRPREVHPAPPAAPQPARAAEALPTPQPGDRVDWGRFFAAIEAVESVNGRRPVGDRGRSLGPYHISRAYWKDATAFGGVRWDYASGVWDRRRCRQVMLWYWQRWCPEALRQGDLATLARIHNGGPRGDGKRNTLRFWHRVRHAM